MALATPSPRARIVRWLDRRRLGCRTERSERNLLRTGGFPSIAVQISPRRGDTLWLVKVHLLSCGAQGVFEIRLFHGSLGGQPFEVSGRLTLQSSPVVQPTSHFHCLVHCLSDAFGFARLYHIVQVSILLRRAPPEDRGSAASGAHWPAGLDRQNAGSPAAKSSET